jgi:signal transduction histidine kinase
MSNSERIHIQTDIQEEEPFYSCELRLAILFKNFISNAIKYLNPKVPCSFLNISIHITHQQARIILRDNGIGISQEYITRIYDMFFRASQVSDGSGLGLYIVKQTIEKLRGNIEVESDLNNGTTFTITLPNLTGLSLQSS